MTQHTSAWIVIPNWNGEDFITKCLESLQYQTVKPRIVVVENGSIDRSVEIIETKFPNITLLKQAKNLGFAGGVNIGIRHALENGAEVIALFNNDAVAEKNWLKRLLESMQQSERTGIVTGKFMRIDRTHIDSAGERYTAWGMPFPRGRDQTDNGQFNRTEEVFGATGGASLYSCEMLREIGLFDEHFFAYYEDVDLSFRAQLAGWKVVYTPDAVAHHKVGASSSKISGFTTYMTIKNLPWLFWKNVPLRLMPKMLPRFTIAFYSIVFSSLAQGRIKPTLKGLLVENLLLPKKLIQRYKIQRNRTVNTDYINSILTHDLPPNATKLRKLSKLLRIK